jgi:hypothetical protein
VSPEVRKSKNGNGLYPNINATNTKSNDQSSKKVIGGFTQAQAKKQQTINDAAKKVDTLNLDLSGKQDQKKEQSPLNRNSA